ncbi:hypothetical protein EWM64_g1602 [Hericium alpestre]|uniref:Uncharacterized protein n=1 Tax=Hericium alpestre TaxID=135208 RepID=A0A4Z0A5U5_9AGAM|nr:hypothetical protein EWM64_g1602 [Hericium alpestre]
MCEKAQKQDPEHSKNDLWGWVQEDSAAEAFLLAITQETDKWRGHERSSSLRRPSRTSSSTRST